MSKIRDIVIVGTGGMARETLWIIERINEQAPTWNILGFVDNKAQRSMLIDGYPVAYDDNDLLAQTESLNVIVAIGSSALRKKVAEKLMSNPVLEFPNIIDPSVIASDRIVIGKGNIIGVAAVLTVGISIDSFNIVNTGCTIGHNAKLKGFVTLSPGVNISGNVVLGSGVEVGTGSQIIQGKSVGKDTVVGAGAVVVKDLPPCCTAVGVPAKPIKFHFE